jgi:hypothetical protein
MRLSKRTLGLVLALVAVAAVITGRAKPALEADDGRGARPEKPVAQAEIDLAKLERTGTAAPLADPFAAKSFTPPERASRRSQAKAEPPSAPPLPFTYFGRLTGSGRTEVFVMRGEELISVAPGQTIDAEYRVDQVTDTAIAFTFLPLKTRQSLELDEAGG